MVIILAPSWTNLQSLKLCFLLSHKVETYTNFACIKGKYPVNMAIMLSVIYTLPIVYISFPTATKDIDIVIFNDFKGGVRG